MTTQTHVETVDHVDGIGCHVVRMPAEKIHYSPARTVTTATPLDHGDKLSWRGLHSFTIFSTVSHALQDGRDPIAAIDRARDLGHELVSIYGNGSMIYAGPRMEPETHVIVEVGMVVSFEGRFYTIERAPNMNLRLQPYDTSSQMHEQARVSA